MRTVRVPLPGVTIQGLLLMACAATPEQLVEAGKMVQKFSTYAPGFKGPITPEESVRAVLETIATAEISKGYAGAFVSHYGNKQWL